MCSVCVLCVCAYARLIRKTLSNTRLFCCFCTFIISFLVAREFNYTFICLFSVFISMYIYVLRVCVEFISVAGIRIHRFYRFVGKSSVDPGIFSLTRSVLCEHLCLFWYAKIWITASSPGLSRPSPSLSICGVSYGARFPCGAPDPHFTLFNLLTCQREWNGSIHTIYHRQTHL